MSLSLIIAFAKESVECLATPITPGLYRSLPSPLQQKIFRLKHLIFCVGLSILQADIKTQYQIVFNLLSNSIFSANIQRYISFTNKLFCGWPLDIREKAPSLSPMHITAINYFTKRDDIAIANVLVDVEEYVTKVNKQFYNKKLYKKLNTAQKMRFSIMDFFSKCDQIHRELRIWSHLLKKFVMENSIFCAVKRRSKNKKYC